MRYRPTPGVCVRGCGGDGGGGGVSVCVWGGGAQQGEIRKEGGSQKSLKDR